MPSIEEKAIFRQVNYIKNKLKGIRAETESVVSLLHDSINVFDHRIEELVRCDVENFSPLYRKLNNEFEEFQEKLIYIQAYVELPSDCEVVSGEPTYEKELQNRNETESSSCFINSKPAASQTPSSSLCPVFPSEIVELPIPFENITESVSSSKLISYPSVKDLENANGKFLPKSCYEINKIESLENVTSQVFQTKCSGGSSAFSRDNFTSSVQENERLNEAYTYSSKSTSFASINDPENSSVNLMSVATEINKNEFTENRATRQMEPCGFEQLEQISSRLISAESLSQTSCNHSVSSNLSDYQSACSGLENIWSNYFNTPPIQYESKNFDSQTALKTRIINSILINCPMNTTATITHIENPGNFWMQLDNFETSRLCYPQKMFLKSVIPNTVKVGDFFLSPSKSVPSYLRVKVVSENLNDNHVKVFFIDHGSTQTVPRKELRILPHESYDIPMQAINCTLADISARNGIWCFAAIQKLREFSNSSVETEIKCPIGEKYAVRLISTVCDFECDIGQSLCYDGFATQVDAPLQITNRNSAPDLCDNNLNSSMQTSNQLSSDSGVSVTSNQPSPPITQTYHYSSDTLNSQVTKDESQFQKEMQELCSERLIFQKLTPENSSKNGINIADLISFESADELQNESIKVYEEEQDFVFSGYNKCLKVCTCKCPLHLLIPFPSINFVEEDKVLVMLSHIDQPNEFYVQMAMENSITLDELLEQMFDVYNPQTAQDIYSILLDDLKVGMFCAAWFEDKNWYRVKVLDIHKSFDQSRNVLVQYVDYGNKLWVKNTDLRVLTEAFAKHPALSVKCSLAAIVPAKPSDCYKADIALWTEEAVNMFKSLVNFEHCLTAEICDRTTILNDYPLQILLWDTQGENDILINKAFFDSGLAMYDLAAVESLVKLQNKKKTDVELLKHWDPMTVEYNDIQNSYGVNFDDFQVATDGYKHRDEEYICKYYSLRNGHCPRIACPYKHVHLGEGGVTRDQDELYSFNCHPLLPKDGSSILIQVSAVNNPSFFYAQLPFGNLTVDELDSLINQGVPRESLFSQEINDLYDALNKHYNDKPFDEITTIGLSYGTIVVARRLFDQTWHRARIIDVKDIAGPAKVFYVDFGNQEWVDRKYIRQILPEYLYAPFQAVECCLYDVEPLGFEKGQKWSSFAVSCFKDLVSETQMLAHIAYKINDTLHVSLRRTTQNDHLTVGEHLIRLGFGQEKLLVKTKKPASKYIPG